MRSVLAVVLLVLASTASASELYIVPAFARHVSNKTLSWQSEVLLTNPYDHAVQLEMELVAGETEEFGCRFPEMDLSFPSALAPKQTRYVCMPFTSAGAFAFRASEPIIVTSEMVAWRRLGEAVVTTRQPVEPGRQWIESGQRAVIPNVRMYAPLVRANLILLNPGDEEITVRYEVLRTGTSPGSYHDYEPVAGSVDVPPHSMKIAALPEGPLHDCKRLVPCANAIEHQVMLESTGRFYAATSSIEDELDASFRGPHVIP